MPVFRLQQRRQSMELRLQMKNMDTHLKCQLIVLSVECPCTAKQAHFLDGENPDQVGFNAFTVDADQLSLATFSIAHYDTQMFNPPAGVDLVEWLQESLANHGLKIPGAPNTAIGGIPAIRIDIPQFPQAFSCSWIYYIKEDLLFQISMIDIDNLQNKALYEKLLSTIEFAD
jgi:type II secretory pathway component PulM